MKISSFFNKSAGLVLASLMVFGLGFGSQASAETVTSQERVLLIVTDLDTHGYPELAPLYSALEQIGVGLPNLPIVNSAYREIHVLRNSNATLSKFRAKIRALSMRNEVKAIDVFLMLHGRTNRLAFYDDTYTMEEVTDFMSEADNLLVRAVVRQAQRKLRLMYNTSCFGASHRNEFIAMGFDTVIGSIGVNANSEAEYPSFLALWTTGNSVAMALGPTNNAGALLATDGPLVAAGTWANNFLKNVNSKKLISGNHNLKITTPAQ